ncbi:tyrosine-type recombinase/integrase [Nonomuraea sp. NPDC003201]
MHPSPTLRLCPVHDPQHAVPFIHPLDQLAHAGHDRRHHRQSALRAPQASDLHHLTYLETPHERRPPARTPRWKATCSIAIRTQPHTASAGRRHTSATNLLRQGINIVVVAELMGHARPDTTRRYTLLTQAGGRAARTAGSIRAGRPG